MADPTRATKIWPDPTRVKLFWLKPITTRNNQFFWWQTRKMPSKRFTKSIFLINVFHNIDFTKNKYNYYIIISHLIEMHICNLKPFQTLKGSWNMTIFQISKLNLKQRRIVAVIIDDSVADAPWKRKDNKKTKVLHRNNCLFRFEKIRSKKLLWNLFCDHEKLSINVFYGVSMFLLHVKDTG